MEIKEAQDKVDKIIVQHGGYWEPLSMLARLTEEVGELSRAMNIKYGGKKQKTESDGEEIDRELADVMFTLIAMSNGLKVDIEKNMNEKIEKDLERNKGVYY